MTQTPNPLSQSSLANSRVPPYIARLTSSLTIPAYRWLWISSLFATMRLITVFVARGWLVLEMTDSAFWVGLAPALRGLTQILLGLFAGVLLDRVNRKYALIVSEIGTTLTALGIGLLVLTGQIELWHIMVASILEGFCVAVRWPAISTILYAVVGPARVLNASATQMFGFNIGNVIASALAGLLILYLGVGNTYLIAALSGVIGLIGLCLIQGSFRSMAVRTSVHKSITDGLTYIRQTGALTQLLLLSFLVSFLGWSNISMLPVMARDVLLLDASGLGFLTAAGAIGSLVVTSAIAGLDDVVNKMHLLRAGAAVTAISIVLFALSGWYPLSLLLMAIMHGALMGFETTMMSVMLLITSDEMQGRVQGIYALVFGFTWLGGVVLGAMAEMTSAPLAIGLGGVVIGLVLVVLWRPLARIPVATSQSSSN